MCGPGSLPSLQSKRPKAAKCFAGEERRFMLVGVGLHKVLNVRFEPLCIKSKGQFPKIVDLTSPQ